MRTAIAVRIVLGAGLALALLAAPTPPAVAQGDAVGALADEVIQGRISRVLDRLDALFAEDQAAANGADVSEAKATALRREVQRLVLRARTARIPLDLIAAALQQAASTRFGAEIPVVFATTAGELDARALIRGTVGRVRAPQAGRSGDSYLSAITDEGSKTEINGRQGSVNETPPPTRRTAASEPAEVTDELESEAERAERDDTNSRVVAVDGARYLVVQSGDTLGSIARDVYGDILLYRRIYEANRDKLSNPNVLTLGIRLVIP